MNEDVGEGWRDGEEIVEGRGESERKGLKIEIEINFANLQKTQER